MALINLDLIGSYAISRGYEWRLAIYYPGNVVNASLWGQIWSAYEPDSALAALSFERGVYEATQQQTKFIAVINSAATKAMLPTEAGFYVYEIRLSLSGKNPQPILAGKVHVLPTIRALQ